MQTIAKTLVDFTAFVAKYFKEDERAEIYIGTDSWKDLMRYLHNKSGSVGAEFYQSGTLNGVVIHPVEQIGEGFLLNPSRLVGDHVIWGGRYGRMD